MSSPQGHVETPRRSAPAPAPTPPSPTTDHRRRWIAAAVLGSAIAVAGAVGVTSLGESDDATGEPVRVPDSGASADQSIPTSDDLTSPAGPVDQPGVSPPVLDVLAVPEPLQTLQPTEIVALSPTLGLVEISLPSGRVRLTDLRWTADDARLATTDFGALAWPATRDGQFSGDDGEDQPSFIVIGEGSQPLAVLGDTVIDRVSSTPGRDGFVVWPDREIPPRGVTADGTITALDIDPSLDARAMDPAGGLLDEGTGGVYRIDGRDARALSSGDLIATGRNHVLLHECDSIRTCRLVALDGAFDRGGGRRRTSSFTTGDLAPDHPLWSALPDGVSPDGDSFLAVSNSEPPALVIVSVGSGTFTSVYSSTTGDVDAAWASDSSGVFFVDGQLKFFGRSDSSMTVVSDVIPDVRTVTTRIPQRSVACELVDAAVSRFDGMRSGTEVGAPSTLLLDELRSAAPADLAAATDDLARFVGAFVSAERADSERIENWPANVRSGVVAIEEYAATDC